MNNKNVGKYSISIFIVLILLSTTYVFCPIGFETNDDTGMLMFVTGAKTGTPTEATIFANVLWGYFLSNLYRFSEKIPWYIITYILLLGAVLTIICRCCLEIFDGDNEKGDLGSSRNNYSVSAWGGGVFIALYLSLFCYSSVLFQLTTMAAFCGIGAILLMKLYPAGNCRTYMGVMILLFFADTIRPKMGFMVTWAFVLMFISMWVLNRRFPNGKYPLLAFSVQVIVYYVNFFYEKVNGWETFRRYHAARAAWKDYPHLSFEQAPQIYEQAGWTEQLFNCAERWFFMDRHINVETFEAINEANHLVLTVSSFFQRLFIAVIKIYNATAQFRVALLLLFLGFAVCVVHCIWKNRINLSLIIFIIMFLPFLILLYFGFVGRMPYRVAFSVVMLFLMPLLFCLVDYYHGYMQSNRQGIKYIVAILLLCLSLISVKSSQGMANMLYVEANKEQRLSSIQGKKRVEKYAMDHPDNIYIYDISLALWGSPFQVYPGKKPYNLTFWGGSGMYSPPYYEQLRANGLETLYSEQFFAKNIYFLGLEEP